MSEKCLFLIITIVKPYYILKAFKLLVQTRLLRYNLECFTLYVNHKKHKLIENTKNKILVIIEIFISSFKVCQWTHYFLIMFVLFCC